MCVSVCVYANHHIYQNACILLIRKSSAHINDLCFIAETLANWIYILQHLMQIFQKIKLLLDACPLEEKLWQTYTEY